MICQRSCCLRTNAHEWIEEAVFVVTALMSVSLKTLTLEYSFKVYALIFPTNSS